MNDTTKTVLVATLGIIVGAGGATMISATGDSQQQMADGTMMHNGSMGSAMEDMMAALEGKTGDEFDKSFLSEMTTHHEGAVSMAQSALQNAKHQEIKQMAQKIISAQTIEIQQMKQWQSSWYGQD